ncbi:unnamed protein product [Larinioides sclopetarius]
MMPPQYSIGQEHYTQKEIYFQDRITPTVTYIRDFVPKIYPHIANIPVPPTKTARYYPASFFVVQHVTPTTYQTERALLPHENFTLVRDLPVTRKWMYTPKPERYKEKIYPTRVDYQYITPPDYEYEDYVPLPYTKRTDYQVEYEHFNEQMVPTQRSWERFDVPRKRYHFTLAPWPTVKYHQTPDSNVYHVFKPRVTAKRIAVVPPVQTIWEYRPVTTAKLYVKQPRVQAFNDKIEVATQMVKYSQCNNFGPWICIDVEHIPIEEIITRSGGCARLDGLECRIAKTREDFQNIGQVITCDIHNGFRCRYSDQRNICNQTSTNMCTCYEVRIRCCERIFESRFRPTTVDTAIIIPEIKYKYEIGVIPLPVTRRVYYPPEERIFFLEHIPQTTFRDIEIPIPKRNIQHVYPGASTSVYRYTAAVEKYHDKVFKSPPKIVKYPAVEKHIEKYFTQTTQKIQIIHQKPRIYEDNRGYVVTRKYHWARTSRGYVERRRNTQIYVVPHKPVVHDYWVKLPTTKVYNYAPKCNNYGPWLNIDVEYITIDEIIKRSGGCARLDVLECRTAETHEDFRVIGQIVTCDIHNGFMCRHSDQRRICNQTITSMCACYYYEVRIRCCIFQEKMTPPPSVIEYFPAEVRLDHKTMLPPKTVMEYYPQQPRLYKHRVIPTKAIIIHIPRPTIHYVQQATQTTAKLYVKQPRAQYIKHEVGAPVTRVYWITAAPRIYQEHQILTTPRIVNIRKNPTKIYIDIYIPHTRVVRYTKPPRIRWFHWTPTTVQDQYVPLTKRVHYHVHPNIPTRIFRFTQHDHYVKRHFARKWIRYFTIPLREYYFTQFQEATTQRWFIPELCRKIIIQLVPLPPTQVMHYRPTERIYFDSKKQTTFKLFVKQPKIESDVQELPPPPTQVQSFTPALRVLYDKIVPAQPVDDFVPLKKRIYGQVLPPVLPKVVHRPLGCLCIDMIVRIECCTKSYTEAVHPPKYVFRYTPPDRQVTQRYHPTTVREYIKMPQVKYYTRELGIQTRKYHFRPKGCICVDLTWRIECCKYHQHVYPTVVNRIWERPRTKQQWEVVPLPQTKIWEIRVTPTVRLSKFFPSTVQDVYIPQQRDKVFITRQNIPPRRIQYPPIGKWYTAYKVPQPTVVWKRTPPIRRVWENIPYPTYDLKWYPVTTGVFEYEHEAYTWVERYTQPDREEECRFPPPRMRTVTSCYRVTRAREICSSEWLEYWRILIRNCTLERLHRRGYVIELQMDRKCVERLQAALAVCIRIIGDTTCNYDKSSFMRWVFEREIIIVGRLGEHGKAHFHANASDEVRKCVILTKEENMDACYPGFRTLLLDILLQGKVNLTLKIDKHRDSSCLMEQMRHCQPSDLQTLEELVYSVFGTCIKMCPSDEGRGGCVDYTLKSRYCNSEDVRRFIQDMKDCITKESKGQKFKELTLKKKIFIVVKCLSSNSPNCIISAWTIFREIILYIIQVLTEKGKEEEYSYEDEGESYKGYKKDYCVEQFTLDNLKPCCQNLIAITSTLQDTRTGMNKETMRSVSNCFRKSLDACSSEICEGFLSILESVCNAAYLTNSDNDFPSYSYRSINSVKVFGDELNICESEYQEDIDYDNNPDVTPVDMCVPLHLSENSSSVKYVIQRSCRGYDIGKWVNASKACMTEQTKKIGMKNPDSLTIERVLYLLQGCISKQGNLKCHPKGRKEYRLLLSSFFNIIRRFSVVSNSSTCQQDLVIENIGKCQTSLYSFLLLKYESSITKDRKTALDCLHKSFKNCSSLVIKNILGILDDAIYPNNSAPIYSKDYTVCQPDDPAFESTRNKCELKLLRKGYLGRKVVYRQKNYDETEKFYYGPTPSLLELKRMNEPKDLHSDQNTNDSEILAVKVAGFSISENLDENTTHSPLKFRQMNEDYRFQTPQNENDSMFYESVAHCSNYHFKQYFETILNCQGIRMNALLYFEGTNCDYDWMQKSLESLIRCLMEDKRYILSCQINSEKQVHDYLEFLSEKLDDSRRFKGEKCSAVKPCYGIDIPQLSTCSNVVYKQVSDRVLPILTERGLSDTLDCLKNVWPYCSSNMSLLTLPSMYAPFGIDLKEIMKETKDSRCLSAKVRSSDSECTSHQKRSATKEIYDCLDRTIRRINDSLSAATEKLHWQVLPLTVCVMMHPILECKQSDHYEFKEFMKDFLEGIKIKLKIYLNIFDEASDIQQGEKCIEQFTSPSINRCLSIMFGYMTSFHKGFAKSSDYPFQCVEDSFKDCGDLNTFHLFMKKSMNVSETDNVKANEVTVVKEEEICIKNENYGLGLHSCLFEDFEKSLTPLMKCPLHEEQNSTAQTALELCKNCILKEVDEMCFYDHHDLTNAIASAFKPISKCLKKLKVNDYCIQDLTNDVKDDCVSRFNEYTMSIKKGAALKATQFANEFYRCLKETIRQCPTDIYKIVFNLYNKISGLEMISMFQSVKS